MAAAAVMMKMALVGKCNKGPHNVGGGKRKKNNSPAKTTFSRTLRTELLPRDGCFDKDRRFTVKDKTLKKNKDNLPHPASKLWNK